MNVDNALTMLFDDPDRFLARNMILISGGQSRPSQYSIFRISDAGLRTVAIPHGARKVQYWRINVSNDPVNRVLQGGNDFAEFRAFYVAMKQIDQSLETTHFALPANGGSDLMLTSQLTGCTFGRGSQVVGGACMASHIQPARGSSAYNAAPGSSSEIGKAAIKMKVRSGIGAGGAILETTGAHSTSVIGKRDGGMWRFIKQAVNRTTNIMECASV